METRFIVSIVLDSAGIVLVLMMVISFLRIKREGTRWFLLFASQLLHLIALFFKVGSSVARGTGQEGFGYGITAMIFDGLSIILLAWMILADEDGRIRLRNRSVSLSVGMIIWAILPSVLALGVELALLKGSSVLGFSYAVSLQIVQNNLFRQTERVIHQREEKLSVDQTKLLTEQMRPHFIFNSLMAIQELCYTDPEVAAESIENLSGYLRGNINALTADELIPFETELRHIEEYVFLEHQDPQRQFEVIYNLAVTDFNIPALSVQPIVENAIKHGALSRRDGKGCVWIETEEVGEFVRVIVRDNGIGQVAKTDKQKKHEGVGLKNVKTRLEAQCGGTFNLELSESGSRAVILVPAKPAN